MSYRFTEQMDRPGSPGAPSPEIKRASKKAARKRRRQQERRSAEDAPKKLLFRGYTG